VRGQALRCQEHFLGIAAFEAACPLKHSLSFLAPWQLAVQSLTGVLGQAELLQDCALFLQDRAEAFSVCQAKVEAGTTRQECNEVSEGAAWLS
jgi:hypothetical protein